MIAGALRDLNRLALRSLTLANNNLKAAGSSSDLTDTSCVVLVAVDPPPTIVFEKLDIGATAAPHLALLFLLRFARLILRHAAALGARTALGVVFR